VDRVDEGVGRRGADLAGQHDEGFRLLEVEV
jgi:hypothetical protein